MSFPSFISGKLTCYLAYRPSYPSHKRRTTTLFFFRMKIDWHNQSILEVHSTSFFLITNSILGQPMSREFT